MQNSIFYRVNFIQRNFFPTWSSAKIISTVKPRIQFRGLYFVYDRTLNQHAFNISESLH